MNVGYMLLFVSFLTLLSSSKEGPIEGSTFPPEPEIDWDHQHHGHSFSESDQSDHGSAPKDMWNNPSNRSNYSRMLTLSTTLGYDDWWFLTTRRPSIYLKDFPGRPGVASWKEISQSSSAENRKSRKMDGPTAAGVSSNSVNLAAGYRYWTFLFGIPWITLILRRLCWP